MGRKVKVPTEDCEIHPANPRMHRDEKRVEELAETIEAKGLQYAPKAVEEDGSYKIFDGGYRLEAAKKAGLDEIVVEIEAVDDEADMIQKALVSGSEVEPLSPVEEGIAFKKLMDEKNLTKTEVARSVGKAPGYVDNRLSLTELPGIAQDAIIKDVLPLGAADILIDEDEETVYNVCRAMAEKYAGSEKQPSLKEVREEAKETAGRQEKQIPILAVQFETFDEKKKIEETAEAEGISASKYIYGLLKEHGPL